MANVSVGFTPRDRGVKAELARLKTSFTGFARVGVSAVRGVAAATKSLFDRFFSLKTLVVGFIGVRVTQFFKNQITATADWADNIAKLSSRLGLTTQFLAEMEFAADRSGVQVDTLTRGFEEAIKRMEEFRLKGTGPFSETLRVLGHDFGDAVRAGKTLEELLPDLSARLASLADEQVQVFVADRLFGGGGVPLLQLLNQGPEAVEELRKRFRDLGGTLDRDAAKGAEGFNDALRDLKESADAIKKSILLQIFPLLTEGILSLTDLIRNNRGAILEFFGDMGLLLTEISNVVFGLTKAALPTLKSLAGLTEPPKRRELSEREKELQRRFGIAPSNPFVPTDEEVEKFEAIEKVISKAEDFFRSVRNRGARTQRDLDSQGPIVGPPLPDQFAIGPPPPPLVRPRAVKEESEAVNSAAGGFKKAVEDSRAEAKKLGEAVDAMVRSSQQAIASGLTSAIFDFAKGTKTAKEAVLDFAASTVEAIGRIIAETLILKALEGITGKIPVGGAAKGGMLYGRRPGFARGGVINSLTTFNTAFGLRDVRELGQNEAMIVPLPDNRSVPVKIVGGRRREAAPVVVNNTTNITVQGSQPVTTRMREALVGMIAQAHRRNVGLYEQMARA